MEPPAGDAPAGILYKGNPQAAAWRQIGKAIRFTLVYLNANKASLDGFI